jgi:phosphatidylglycerophosphate synthase
VPTLSWAEYAERWSKLHGGFDPRSASRLVRGWLLLSYRVSRPLARTGTGPNTVTTIGLVLSAGVALAAWPGERWPLLAALLVLVSALADTADGALALSTGKASRLGHVYDSAADRLSEAAWAIALALLGAPAWLAAAAGGVGWLHEYIRARATVAGMADVGTVTIGERPTRIIVVFFTLAVAGALSAYASTAVTIGTAVWVVLGGAALVQLAIAVRRALRGADPIGD